MVARGAHTSTATLGRRRDCSLSTKPAARRVGSNRRLACRACDVRAMTGEAARREGALRVRAELYLLHELITSPGWPSHYSRSAPDSLGRRNFERDEGRHVLQQFGGAVEVLRAIGVLDEEEALAWCSRFLSAVDSADASPQEAPPDPAAAERSRRRSRSAWRRSPRPRAGRMTERRCRASMRRSEL